MALMFSLLTLNKIQNEIRLKHSNWEKTPEERSKLERTAYNASDAMINENPVTFEKLKSSKLLGKTTDCLIFETIPLFAP